ncbi:hypothetical protein SAMN05428996_0109 [Quadrisphaera sp. DSM 44207]|nr:hypothetical protein SAMN05428996_0109 [Quadrisphaera sp. DSM 44207]
MDDMERGPAEAPDEGAVSEVIRPAAIVPEEAARAVLVELALRDVQNGGVWQSEPNLWSRYDRPWHGLANPAGAALIGTIQVAYGTPTKYEITVYRVTVTRLGVDSGWNVESLTDEALGYGGITLASCPRATLAAPPKPFRF